MQKTRASYGCLAVTAAVTAAMMFFPAFRQDGVQDRTACIETAQVCLGTVERTLALSGRVRYETEYAALSPASGLVTEVYVKPGQHVSAGQPLFRLDGTMQEAAMAACLAQQAPVSAAVPEALSYAAQEMRAVSAADSLRASQQALDALTVRAQIDGLVQQVSVTAHSGIAMGSPAVTLSGEHQQVIASAALRDAERLAVGQRARILVQGKPQTQAAVQHISAASTDPMTGQVTCQVTLSLEEPLPLPLGAQVEAEVELLRAEQVTIVPLQAITADNTLWWIADGRAWETPADVLARDEVAVWVPLPEGTKVVLSADRDLRHGQRVKEARP